MKYRMMSKAENENIRWNPIKSSISWNEHYSKLGLSNAVEAGLCGYGAKVHTLNVKFIVVGGENVIVSISTKCGSGYTNSNGQNSLFFSDSAITCKKCSK